jgi:ribonuclease T1
MNSSTAKIVGICSAPKRYGSLGRVCPRQVAATITFGLALLGSTIAQADARGGSDRLAIGTVAKSQLPKEGQETLALIRKGGPFPFPRKDGSTFGNRERILPKQARGFYTEYTVITPGSRDRGARRIVCGGDSVALRDPAKSTCFYTSDHYASFKRILE